MELQGHTATRLLGDSYRSTLKSRFVQTYEGLCVYVEKRRTCWRPSPREHADVGVRLGGGRRTRSPREDWEEADGRIPHVRTKQKWRRKPAWADRGVAPLCTHAGAAGV